MLGVGLDINSEGLVAEFAERLAEVATPGEHLNKRPTSPFSNRAGLRTCIVTPRVSTSGFLRKFHEKSNKSPICNPRSRTRPRPNPISRKSPNADASSGLHFSTISGKSPENCQKISGEKASSRKSPKKLQCLIHVLDAFLEFFGVFLEFVCT